MKRKILFSIVVLTVAFSAGIALKTKAGVGDSGTGWLWGGSEEAPDGTINGNETGVGWISMNSTNCDADSNGFIDVNYCDLDNNTFVDALCGGDNTTDISASCSGNNTTTAVVDYGVNIPVGNGNVSGEAWSKNLGYINFDPAGDFVNYPGCGFPSLPCNSAQRNGNNLEGWARITDIQTELAIGNSGGWEGWIKMRSVVGDPVPYGVGISGANLTGQAWANGEELGWIDFTRALIVIPKTLKICENACDSGIMRAIEGIPDSLSVTEGDPDKNLRACYNNDPGCGDSNGDMTLDGNTAWVETAVTGDAFSLAVVASNEVMSFNAVAADTTENLSATYTDAGTPHTADFDVTVTNTCSCKACDASDNCVDTTYTGASCPCADSCTVIPNSCAPPSVGSDWKEVAP